MTGNSFFGLNLKFCVKYIVELLTITYEFQTIKSNCTYLF